MILSLDTNILFKDFHLEGTQFSVLLESKDDLGIKLKIPQLVIDEAVNKHGEHIANDIKKLKNATSKLEKKLKRPISDNFDFPNPTLEKEEYRKYLNSKLALHNVEIIEAPELSINQIIQRDLDRKKPFSNSSGYRDYIIWRTFAKLGKISSQEKIVFISNNKSDFAEDEQFHAELIEELEELNILNPRRFEYFTSLKEFNDEYILPQLTKVEDINKELSDRGIDSLDLHNWVKNNLNNILTRKELLEVGADLKPGIGESGIPTLVSPPEIGEEKFYKLSNSDYALRFEITLDVEYDIDFENEDFMGSLKVRRIFGENVWGSTTVEWNNTFNIVLEIVIDAKSGDVKNFDLISIDKKFSLI